MGMFQDKEIMAAFQDILSNPGNISKYQSNPKIMSALNQMMGQMGGMTGMPGMGGFPGMGGMPGMGAKTNGQSNGHSHESTSESKSSTEIPTKPNSAASTDDLD